MGVEDAFYRLVREIRKDRDTRKGKKPRNGKDGKKKCEIL